MQTIFADAILDLIVQDFSLPADVKLLLISVSLGTRLHLLYIDTLLLGWEGFSSQSGMRDSFNETIQAILFLVLFRSFTEFGRLLSGEEKGVIAEHMAA